MKLLFCNFLICPSIKIIFFTFARRFYLALRIYGMFIPFHTWQFICKFKPYRRKVLAHCSRNRKGKKLRMVRVCNRMQVAIATIYFLNYKDAVAEAWKKVASLPRANSRRVCERREGGKSWKLSEIEHDFFEKLSPAPLWDYEHPPLPFPLSFSLSFVFAIYPSRVSFSLFTLSIPKFR